MSMHKYVLNFISLLYLSFNIAYCKFKQGMLLNNSITTNFLSELFIICCVHWSLPFDQLPSKKSVEVTLSVIGLSSAQQNLNQSEN